MSIVLCAPYNIEQDDYCVYNTEIFLLHIPNKTHNLISQFSRFPSFVHIAYKGGKKEGKDVTWSSYAQRTEGIRVEKLPGLHLKVEKLFSEAVSSL